VSVIINEFEIVPAPEAAAKPEATPPPQPATAPLVPQDIERVGERQRQRLRRLMAD
jgi:hypothetical protein